MPLQHADLKLLLFLLPPLLLVVVHVFIHQFPPVFVLVLVVSSEPYTWHIPASLELCCILIRGIPERIRTRMSISIVKSSGHTP
eukprot:754943-Hanusia_phi.AAC.1